MVGKCERLRDDKSSPFSLVTAATATLTRLGGHDDVYLTEDSSTPIPSEFFKDQRCPHFSSCSDSATKDQDLKETLSVQLGSLVGNAKLNAKLNDVDLL
ncbi:hypothetical protein Tco_0483649 [Tanacetum coccineum]